MYVCLYYFFYYFFLAGCRSRAFVGYFVVICVNFFFFLTKYYPSERHSNHKAAGLCVPAVPSPGTARHGCVSPAVDAKVAPHQMDDSGRTASRSCSGCKAAAAAVAALWLLASRNDPPLFTCRNPSICAAVPLCTNFDLGVAPWCHHAGRGRRNINVTAPNKRIRGAEGLIDGAGSRFPASARLR